MNLLKLKNSCVKIFLECFVANRKSRSILKARWAKYNLKKYAKFACDNIESFLNTNNENQKIIWQYWHQGVNNAPDIIKKCFESIKKHHSDYEINILDFDSIKQYVELPENFYTLLERKKIPIAIFSDILRLNLLSKYGGIWIDSTMFATKRLPDDILNAEFFVFQKDSKIDSMENCMSCYFIKANKNNPWVNLIKDALESYWSENDYLVNYFMFEHMVTILAELLPEEWKKIPFYPAGDTCEMQFKFFKKYDKENFDEILNKSSIHKLTYKNFPEKINDDTYCAELFKL